MYDELEGYEHRRLNRYSKKEYAVIHLQLCVTDRDNFLRDS